MILKLSVILLSLFILLQPKGTKLEHPLQLKLTSKVIKPCAERKLLLKAELVNKSSEKVVIDKKSVWYRISVRRSDASSTMVGDVGNIYEGDFLVLSPGESYKSRRIINLDEDFFNTSGDYEISVAYGQFSDEIYEGISVWRGIVESNDSKFKLKRCKVSDTLSRPLY